MNIRKGKDNIENKRKRRTKDLFTKHDPAKSNGILAPESI
jgi:hypothetical protein